MVLHKVVLFSGVVMTVLLLGGCTLPSGRTPVSAAPAAGAYESGDYARAATEYAAYLEVRPADPNAWYRLGTALAHEGRLREAQSALEKSLGLDPDHARARYNLGLVHVQLGWQHILAGREGMPADFDDSAAVAYLTCLLSVMRGEAAASAC